MVLSGTHLDVGKWIPAQELCGNDGKRTGILIFHDVLSEDTEMNISLMGVKSQSKTGEHQVSSAHTKGEQDEGLDGIETNTTGSEGVLIQNLRWGFVCEKSASRSERNPQARRRSTGEAEICSRSRVCSYRCSSSGVRQPVSRPFTWPFLPVSLPDKRTERYNRRARASRPGTARGPRQACATECWRG
jgi:hypothetical protein